LVVVPIATTHQVGTIFITLVVRFAIGPPFVVYAGIVGPIVVPLTLGVSEANPEISTRLLA